MTNVAALSTYTLKNLTSIARDLEGELGEVLSVQAAIVGADVSHVVVKYDSGATLRLPPRWFVLSPYKRDLWWRQNRKRMLAQAK